MQEEDLRVAIRWRQGADLGDSGRAIEVDVVPVNRISGLVTVEVGDDGELGGGEVVLLDQHLGAHSAVDARGRVVLETRAEDVPGAEAERGQTRVDVGEVVVVVRHV